MEDTDPVEQVVVPKLKREVIIPVAPVAKEPPSMKGMTAPLTFALSAIMAGVFGLTALVTSFGSKSKDTEATGGFAVVMLVCSVVAWGFTRRSPEQRAAVRRLFRAAPRFTYWLFVAASVWGVLATLVSFKSPYAHGSDLVVTGMIAFGGASLALLSKYFADKWRAEDGGNQPDASTANEGGES